VLHFGAVDWEATVWVNGKDLGTHRGGYDAFDIDALDPAFAPGTGTPEIGGLASWQAQAVLHRLRGLPFMGMDVVEVAPAYDVSEITALAAATVVWEYLALVGSC
jgi:guanidinopropionase